MKKIHDSVRDAGYAGARILVLVLESESLNNCVRTQLITNYETLHYGFLNAQNRGTQSKNEREKLLECLGMIEYET